MMMKNLKNLLPVIAIVLGLSLVLSQSAFKFADKKSTTLRYRYIGTDEAGLTTLANWDQIDPEETPSTCETGTELPCLVSFEDDQYDDIVDFYSTHDTAAEMFTSLKVVNKKD